MGTDIEAGLMFGVYIADTEIFDDSNDGCLTSLGMELGLEFDRSVVGDCWHDYVSGEALEGGITHKAAEGSKDNGAVFGFCLGSTEGAYHCTTVSECGDFTVSELTARFHRTELGALLLGRRAKFYLTLDM